MTVSEILNDVQHHIYVSKDRYNGGYWARIDAVPNPTLGATRFPISYEEYGRTRGIAIKKLYQSLKHQGGLINLKSEKGE